MNENIYRRKKETFACFFGDLLTCHGGSVPFVYGDGGWRLKVEMCAMWNLYFTYLFLPEERKLVARSYRLLFSSVDAAPDFQQHIFF